MSATIVFVVIKDGEVANVTEDENLANVTAARYEGAKVDAWVLDSRSADDATLDEWLLGRKVYPVDNLKDGDVVYFSDDVLRGIGKIVPYSENGTVIRIEVAAGDAYDKIAKRECHELAYIHMYPADIKGIVK